MGNSVINKYLIFEFLKAFLNVILVFSSLGLIMNLFEEINYFKNYNVGIIMPLTLSFMVVPSILLKMLPFIIFLSSMWAFIKLKNNRDILSLKTFGYSNIKFLVIFSATAFIIGIVTLVALNPLTSIVVKYYEDIKGDYNLDKSHLASINAYGIWIKENMQNKVRIIRSKELNGDFLNEVSVYIFDEEGYLIKRLEAKKADVSTTPWIMFDVNSHLLDDGENIKKSQTLVFNSNFNKDRLNSIYSNLDIISFYRLITEKQELISKGYNENLLEERKHFYLSLPFFLVLMVILSGIFSLNSNEKRQNIYYLLLSIIICVIVYYFNNFSAALGSTERIPLVLAVWAPVIALTLFCSIAVIQINEK